MLMRDNEQIRRELTKIEAGEDTGTIYAVYTALINDTIDDNIDGVIDNYMKLIGLFRKHVSAESLAFLSYTFQKALDIYTERLLDDEETEDMVYMQRVAEYMDEIIENEDD